MDDARAFGARAFDAPGLGPSRAACRSVSLMLRCHPGPRLRKCAMTSRSRRSEIDSFVGAFCGPRRRRNASTTSGITSTAGRMRESLSSGHGGLSGSLSAPAVISAASSSVMSASCRKALRRASRHPSFELDSFGILSRVSGFRFAKADHPDQFVSPHKDENVKPVPNEAPRDFSQLAIILTIIDLDISIVPVEIFNGSKVDLMPGKIRRPFDFIPIVVRPLIHELFHRSIEHRCQLFCRYKLTGAIR